MWRLNVQQALHFFDEVTEESARHASPLIGVFGEEMCTALLVKYLRESQKYTSVSILMKDGRPATPSLGTKKGPRLDRWLVAKKSKDRADVFQVEIKNWSAHAFGGRNFPIDSQPDKVVRIAEHYWGEIWNENENRFRDASVGKVLTRMKLPDQIATESINVIPLVCFWWYVTDPLTGDSGAMFERAIIPPINTFEKVHIFSASNYLRTQLRSGFDNIEIEMPHAETTTKWMQRIFVLPAPSAE